MTISVKMPARWCQCTSDASSHRAADKTSADRNPDAAIGIEITPMAAKILLSFRSSALYELPDA
jgi:hypothetical protein